MTNPGNTPPQGNYPPQLPGTPGNVPPASPVPDVDDRPYYKNLVQDMIADMRAAVPPSRNASEDEMRAYYDDRGLPRPGQVPTEQQERADRARRSLSAPNLVPIDPLTTDPAWHDQDFEQHRGHVSSAAVGVGGLFRVFTREGRQELRDRREGRLEQRARVADWVRNRVLDPRNTSVAPDYRDPNDPNFRVAPDGQKANAKLGWVRTSSVYHSIPNRVGTPEIPTVADIKLNPKDAGTYGDKLLKKAGSKKVPNTRRPTTWAEKRADRVIEAKDEKMNVSRNNANWIDRSYGDQLDASSDVRLSYGEEKHMRKLSRRARRLERKAEKAARKIDKVGNNQDWRGRHLPL